MSRGAPDHSGHHPGLKPRTAAILDLFGHPAVDATAKLVRDDPYDTADLAALERAERRLDLVTSFVAATEVKLSRRRRELAAAGHAAPVDHSAGGMRSAREQRAAAGRESVCDRLPDVEDALSGGKIAAGHVDAIANATARLSEQEKARFDEHAGSLVDQATAESVDDFTRTCQNLARAVQADEGESKLNEQRRNNKITHRVDERTGMHHIHAELDPETGTKVLTAIRATITTLKHHNTRPEPTPEPAAEPEPATPESADPQSQRDQIIATALRVVRDRTAQAASYDELMVQAFVELVTGARALDRRIPEISVLIDYQTLLDGLHERSCSETSSGEPLPPETIRRLCCDGAILPIVLGGRSEVLDVGRSQRLATPAQRNALRAMYTSCVIPGCDVAFDRCEIHHVDEWTGKVGETNLDRLVPICPHDHHRIHEGHWTLHLNRDPARTITLHRPDGTIEFQGPSIQRRPVKVA
jgi:hypothetical protein